MSLRKKPFVAGEFYHIYNRGNGKQVIFNDSKDYLRFLKILNLFNTKNYLRLRKLSEDFFISNHKDSIVSIGCYCLMPNHFHLILTEKEEGGISKFMQRATTAYAMYYNKKYDRTGSLFEGKFKSEHVGNDVYLKYLFSYIHLNPVKLIQKDWKKYGVKDKKEALEFLKKYKYSSYLDYLELPHKEGRCILEREVFPDYFPTKENFQKEIFEWLSINKKQ